MEKIGEQIKRLREEKGLSQRELARRLGRSNTHIRNLEIGEKTPNLNILEEIANVLNVDLNIFNVSLTKEEQDFMSDLELTNEELINKYNLTVDGKPLSPKELKLFFNQVRTLRDLEGE